MTRDAGLAFTCRNGEEANNYSILESLGGGVGLLDYDRDGDLDILLAGGGGFKDHTIHGYPCKLFRNEGNWKFTDASQEAGVEVGEFYNHGVAVADFNDDGWPDVLITGYGRLALLRNDQGKFTQITAEAGLTDPNPLHWSTSAAWADFSGDGRLDLFVPHYVDWSFENNPKCKGYRLGQEVDVCPPEKFNGLLPALYINEGGGKFRPTTDNGFKPGKALGTVAFDFDGDSRLDIYVANDGVANQLYRNLGDEKFAEVAESAGVAFDAEGRASGSMGVDIGDVDGSGLLALFVANYENEMHCLYRNFGKGQFQCVSRAAGITAIGQSYVGFGTGFCDFDRDGALDLFISNGHVVRHPARGDPAQKPVLFHNTRELGKVGPAKFAIATELGGDYFRENHLGRGVALGDLDNDGRVDLVISHTNSPVTLLRNQVENENQWLGVELLGQHPRDPIGARVTLTQGNTKQTAVVKGGGSYLSTSDRRIVFGLGSHREPVQINVRWPDGSEESWEEKSIGKYVSLAQGKAAAK
jgi:hypothetical protein